MQDLNIGWNTFTAENLARLGECLIEGRTVRSLGLANCVKTLVSGHVSPVLHFVEFLSRDRQLRKLDLALNRIDYRGALIIEDALMAHSKLEELNMDNNPLGRLGLQSMLRLLSLSESGLQNFHIRGCHSGVLVRDTKHQILAPTNPSGRYVLDLEYPYSRSLLRMMYKLCGRFDMKPELAFKDISAKGFGGQFAHAAKDADGIWAVNTRGRITLTFTTERAVDSAPRFRDIDEADFEKFLNTHNDMMRYKPAFNKVVPLFAQFKKLEGYPREQEVFIDALSKDFSLTYPQLKNICAHSAPEAAAHIIWELMPCIVGGDAPLYLSAMLTPTLSQLIKSLRGAHAFIQFNVQNPTGHYRLDLSNPTQFKVAEWLMLLDRWEVGIALKHERLDTSQRGNRSQVRNEKFEGRPLTVHSMCEWTLPNYECLEFDYCSTKRAPPEAAYLDKVTWFNILAGIQQSELADHLMIKALQKVSHNIYLRSIHLRDLLGIIKKQSYRIEVIVIFFNRIVDVWNEKVFRVRLEDEGEYTTMCRRVGYCAFFPFVQPEQIQLEYDLQYYDQRMAAHCLVMIAFKERPENVTGIQLTHVDGTADPLPTGLPRGWEALDRIPTAGVFRASYRCAPEDRKFQTRKALLLSHGFYRMPVEEDEVMWWADIRKVPEDVFQFLAFIADRFPTCKAAYQFINGPTASHSLSLHEFEDGLKKLGFHKFHDSGQKKKAQKKGHQLSKEEEELRKKVEKERITNVFRYLDPSGEGQVSLGEFCIQEQLWNEVTLCISEFMQFLERTIGKDLDEVWSFFDESGDGSIDPAEFDAACQDIGYYGPVRVIFNVLDKDGEGTISAEEFCELQLYQNCPDGRP